MDILIWIQQFRSPFLDVLFQGVTMLGEVTFYIVILTIVYWCVNKEYGAEMTFTLLFSGLVNSSLKLAFHIRRPIGMEGIESLREHTATGYSFPSGHTQSAASFWFYLMITQKRLWTYLAGGLIMFLVAFSRLYLGVHWPIDVIGGILFALFSVYLGRWIYRLGFREGGNMLLPLAPAVIVIPPALIIGDENLTKVAAMMSGAVIGLICEKRWVNFSISRVFWKQIVKFAAGTAVLLIIKEGGSLLLPEAVWADWLRYFLIGLWAAAGAPLLFRLTRL